MMVVVQQLLIWLRSSTLHNAEDLPVKMKPYLERRKGALKWQH